MTGCKRCHRHVRLRSDVLCRGLCAYSYCSHSTLHMYGTHLDDIAIACFWLCHNLATCANILHNASLCTQFPMTCAAARTFRTSRIQRTIVIITLNVNPRGVYMAVRTIVTTPVRTLVSLRSDRLVVRRYIHVQCTHTCHAHTLPEAAIGSMSSIHHQCLTRHRAHFRPNLCHHASASAQMSTLTCGLHSRSFTSQQQYTAAALNILLALPLPPSAATHVHDPCSS